MIAEVQAAARTLGLQLIIGYARTDSDLETTFATLSQQRVGAVLVSHSSFFIARREQLAALAARHALPTISEFRESALVGGLMSYGTSIGYHQVGIYTGRILKGEKPAGADNPSAHSAEAVPGYWFPGPDL
jgi:putative ABC transport system substrate-binding protein